MTERVRRRTSKWDLKEDPDSYPVEGRQENVMSGKASEFIHDNGSKRERNSSKNIGTRISKWSDNDPQRGSKSESNSRWSRWDTPSGNRDEQKDNYVSRDFNEVSQSRKKWDGDRSYSTSLSPGRDDWRQRSRSLSPRSRWSKSHRSRSRSPPHGFRSRSITPPHGLRSRSRSPPYGLKRGYDEWDNRIRSGSGVSAPLCNDFAMGRCRRGSECRFLHQENNESESRRNQSGVPTEYWGSRHERGGSYGHLNNVERDYSRDKLSHGHESQRNNRSSDQCVSFLRGKCHRGSSCTYIHDDSLADGRGTGERIHERDTDAYSGRDHRRDPSRNNITLCKFFASGNCRKGTSCRFSHEGGVLDKPEGRSADRRGHNLGNENKLWGGPKWGDEAAVTACGNVEGSSLDESGPVQGNGWGDPRYNHKPVGSTLNVEAADDVKRQNSFGYENKSGRGPKGSDEVGDSAHHTVGGRPLNEWSRRIADSGPDDLRYKHKPVDPTWNGEAVNNQPEGRSWDERRGHNLGSENKSWAGPKRIEVAANTAHGGVEGGSLNDGRDRIANSAWDGPTWNDVPAAPKVKTYPRWGNDDNGGQLGDREEKKLPGGPNWSSNATESEMTKISEWRNDNAVRNGVPVSLPTQGSLDDRRDCRLDDQNRSWEGPTWRDKPSDQNVQMSPSASMGTKLSMGSEEFLKPSAGTERGASAFSFEYSITTNSEKPKYEVNVSSEIFPIIPVHGQFHNTANQPLSSFNMNVQSQQISSFPAPSVRSFDLNGPVEDVPSPHHQKFFNMGESFKEAGSRNDPVMSPMSPMSPIASGVSATPNVVTSEQVAQISNLSASLAHIFGDNQQLPQLYATLNSTNAMPSQIYSEGEGGSFVQSSQDTWSQKQYIPVSNGMELSQNSIRPPGFSENPIKPNTKSDQESHAPLESSIPSSVAGGPNGSHPSNNGSLEKTVHHERDKLKHLESVGNEKVVEPVVKERDNGHSVDAKADGPMNEDDNRSKDTKAMRMFKFALVEFVKEILKPTWKGGQLNKEAHKTVVKKVVDKVTGSVQGDHIPQTQDRIDQYLAYSKSKLTKLVEAYVEKSLKT